MGNIGAKKVGCGGCKECNSTANQQQAVEKTDKAVEHFHARKQYAFDWRHHQNSVERDAFQPDSVDISRHVRRYDYNYYPDSQRRHMVK